MRKNNGLNDSDKIFVTVALWVAAVSILATALTLPMLPNNVFIFTRPGDGEGGSSKYFNLILIFASVIPTAILIIAASLKKRNKISRNFMSIMLFCIMLSACLAGVTIYGISRQFAASSSVKSMDNHTLISVVAAIILSMLFACLPTIMHSKPFVAGSDKRSLRTVYFCHSLDYYWNVGAYGFCAGGIVSSFLQNGFSYIPLAAAVIGAIIFYTVNSNMNMKRGLENVLYDAIDSETAKL